MNECSQCCGGPRLLAVLVLTLALAFVPTRNAAALPGPPLTEPKDALHSALACDPGLDTGKATPALLIHGTFGDAHYWSGNMADALRRDHHPVCALTTPGRQFIDAQRSTEYVVQAVRVMSERAGRPIAIVTHSQAGLLATLALRFWPDVAQRVSDFVGLAGVYENGDQATAVLCRVACPPAGWQIRPGSNLLRAFARKSAYEGPAYTSIATAYDLLVTPQPAASHLAGARNITLQDICPERPVEHMTIAYDALAYALVLDAIEHDGPADPKRLPRATCRTWLIPGADTIRFAEEVARAAPFFGQFPNGASDGEPPLRCYLDPTCPKTRLRPRLQVAISRGRSGRVRGIVELPAGAVDQCSGSVRVLVIRRSRRLAERSLQVRPNCRFVARLPTVARRGIAVALRYSGSSELLPARGTLRPAGRTR